VSSHRQQIAVLLKQRLMYYYYIHVEDIEDKRKVWTITLPDSAWNTATVVLSCCTDVKKTSLRYECGQEDDNCNPPVARQEMSPVCINSDPLIGRLP